MNAKLVTTTVVRTYLVADIPPMQMRYRWAQLIPRVVVAEFRDGAWSRLTISGLIARKDGTAGTKRAETIFYADNWQQAGSPPAWAETFIDPAVTDRAGE